MKVMSIVGTRPEIIKMSQIIKLLDDCVEHIFVHTGQNYDPQLKEVFYKDLNLRRPDVQLEWHGNDLGAQIASNFYDVSKVLMEQKPEAVVILGDTNSAIGAGYLAKRMKIPLFHLEAGNRCFDDNVPEEINRRILDHISDVNMVYTENQRRNLLMEGVAKDRIFVMGSPMQEVFNDTLLDIESSDVLVRLGLEYPEAARVPYFLVSIHRDENVEIKKNLDELLKTLEAIHAKYELPIIVSTHPRLRNKLEDRKIPGVRFMKPFGFLDYNKLQMNAKCVISDSGTISEESAILGFPAVTIRNAMERIEAVDVGSILMTGVNCEAILNAIDIAKEPIEVPVDYEVYNCAERVVKVIIGYTPYVNRYVWHK